MTSSPLSQGFTNTLAQRVCEAGGIAWILKQDGGDNYPTFEAALQSEAFCDRIVQAIEPIKNPARTYRDGRLAMIAALKIIIQLLEEVDA